MQSLLRLPRLVSSVSSRPTGCSRDSPTSKMAQLGYGWGIADILYRIGIAGRDAKLVCAKTLAWVKNKYPSAERRRVLKIDMLSDLTSGYINDIDAKYWRQRDSGGRIDSWLQSLNHARESLSDEQFFNQIFEIFPRRKTYASNQSAASKGQSNRPVTPHGRILMWH